jgi:hypothetical protein
MVTAMIAFFVVTWLFGAKIPGTPPDQSPLTIKCISSVHFCHLVSSALPKPIP